MKQCPQCPYTFETQADFDTHMKEFGSNKEEHLERFRKAHASMNQGSKLGVLAPQNSRYT